MIPTKTSPDGQQSAADAQAGEQAQGSRAQADIPRHVAIIMDGNGRWAQQRNLPRIEGHRQGVDNIHRIVPAAIDLGIAVITLYAFSTENWGRPQEEVSGLMQLFTLASRRETRNLHEKGVRIQHIGTMEGVGLPLARAIEDAVALTRRNTALQLNIAFNYGGRAEIVRAVRELMAAGAKPEDICEESISQHLYTGGGPDPDLIVRTAGEMRLSNFLLWQAAYSEYYASPKLWPDFGAEDLQEAVESFARRHRKYGRL